MLHESVPCRIHFILAREAPVGVVFRRGPSKWVQLLRWNLDDDTFEPGQWFHGRIYERRADLSPDGRYLVYFASKQQNWGRVHRNEPDTLISWTAVSRPPYLTALALWPQTDTWNGGGLFETNRKLAVSTSFAFEDLLLPQPDQPVPSTLSLVPYQGGMGEDFPLMGDRIVRDGWRETTVNTPLIHAGSYQTKILIWTYKPSHWAKNVEGSDFELIWSRVGYHRSLPDWHGQAFSLRHRASNEMFFLPEGTEWADWDHQKRLIWAQGGKIWALPLPQGETVDISEVRMVIDLESNQPESIAASDWAKQW